MIEKKTIVEQIDVKPGTGHVMVRMVKLLMEGEREISRQYHRAMLEPDTDLDLLAQQVNEHLLSMGEAPVEDFHWDQVRRHANIVRTPAVVDAWNKQKEARIAEAKIRQELHDKAVRDAEKQLNDSIMAAARAMLREKGETA